MADSNTNVVYSYGISSGVGGSLLNIAGSGTKATVVGTGTGASFSWPYGVAVAPDASFLLVGEQSGAVLRKIFLQNRTAIIVGSGMSEVAGVVYSNTPNIYYVLEGTNQRISAYNDATGTISLFTNLNGMYQGFAFTGGNFYLTFRTTTLFIMPASTKVIASFTTLTGTMFGQPGVSPDGTTLAIPMFSTNQVALVTIATKAVVYVGSGVSGSLDGSRTTSRFASMGTNSAATYSLDGLYIYVTQSNGYIRVINTQTLAVTTALTTGGTSAFTAIMPSVCATPSQTYTCGSCPASQYFPNGQCVACPIGSFCVDNVKTACPAFQTSTVNATTCFCIAGYYNNSGTCAPCPLNNYCPANSQTPTSCPAGQYAPVTGSVDCISCAAGLYCPQGNSLSCPSNAISPVGSTSILNCSCNPGYYTSDITQGCTICPVDSYCGNNQMYACPAGSTAPQGSVSYSACMCPAPSYLGGAETRSPFESTGYYENCETFVLLDTMNHMVYTIGMTQGTVGSRVPLAGSGTAATVVGTNGSASFNKPSGVATSPDGTFALIGEVLGCVLRKVFILNGTAIIALGSTGSCSSVDGSSPSARLSGVNDVAYIPGSKSNYLVAETSMKLRIYNEASGSISTIATMTVNPLSLSITADSRYAFISGQEQASIYRLDLVTRVVTTWISGLSNLVYGRVGLSADNSLMVVPSYLGAGLRIVNVATATVIATTDGGFNSAGYYQSPIFSADDKSIYLWTQEACIKTVNVSTNKLSKTSCPGGTGFGFMSRIPSTACPARTSTAQCASCPASQYRAGEWLPCLTCSCTQCAANTYYGSNVLCNTCPLRSTSPPGSTVISNCSCPVGYYTALSAICSVCPVGSYCVESQQITCPSNSTSLTGSTLLSNCTCNNGYYTNDITQGCAGCPAGSYCTGSQRTTCPAGTYSAALATACTPCASGYYTASSGQSQCAACLNNSYCQGGVMRSCPAGSVSYTGSAASYCRCTESGFYFSNNTCRSTLAGYGFNFDGALIQLPNPLTLSSVSAAWATSDPNCRSGSCVSGNFMRITGMPTVSFTISYWMKFSSDVGVGNILSLWPQTGGSYDAFRVTTNTNALYWRNIDVTSGNFWTNLITWTAWNHFTMSFTPTGVTFYLNGANKVTGTFPLRFTQPSAFLDLFTSYTGYYDDLIVLPFALTSDTQALGLYQTGINSISLCTGSNQQVDAQGNCACDPGYFNNSGTCAVCYQGYYCTAGSLTVCPAGTMSLAGSTACTSCSNPSTNTSIALALCGLRSCPAGTPTQIGSTAWYGLGRVQATTAGNGIVPVSTWSFGETVLGLLLNTTGDRPVSLVQTTLSVTAGKAYAIRFKAVCTGAQCAANLVVDVTMNSTTSTALTVSQVARSWMELATPYFVPTTSTITVRFTSQMITASTSTVWIARTTLVDLGRWGYTSLSTLQLLNGVSLPQRFSVDYVEYTSTVLMRITSGGYLQYNSSGLLPGQTYQLTLWSQGATIGAQFQNASGGWSAMAQVSGYDTWPSWSQSAWLASASALGALNVRILANAGTVTIASPALSLQQPVATMPCVECLANYWCHGTAINLCPMYTLSAPGSKSQTDCFCQAGYYGSVGVGDYTGYSPCSICPVNYYCTGGNALTVCPDGYKSSAGASVCTPCGTGEICSGGQVGSCPDNSYAADAVADVSQCLCVAGYYGIAPNCTLCTPGYYCPGGHNQTACTSNAVSPAGSTDSTQCFCDRGYYGVQNTDCTQCPEGSWCWTGIQNACPANMNSPLGSSYQSNCSCNPGYTGANGGPCSACSAGAYKETQGTDECTTCGAGTSSTALAATTAATCAACAAGSYNPSAAQTACQPCAAGQYVTGQGFLSCVGCGTGVYSTGGASACANCAAGTFSAASQATAAASCASCGTGYYAVAGSTACSACGACPYFTWPTHIVAQLSGSMATFSTISDSSGGATQLAEFSASSANYNSQLLASVGTSLYTIDPTSAAASSIVLFSAVEGSAFEDIAVARDGGSVYVVQSNVYRFSASTFSLLNVYTLSSPVGAVESLDGVSVWVGSAAGLTEFDVDLETVLQTVAPPSDSTGVALSPCLSAAYPDTLFAVGASPFGFRQYHAGQWLVLDTSLTALTKCRFTPDSNFVLLSSYSGGLWLWSATLGTLQTVSMSPTYGILASALFTPGTLLASQASAVVRAQPFVVLDGAACGPGLYSASGGLASASQCSTCPAGGLCPGGANLTYCAPGTRSGDTGLRLQAQCGPCTAGYFCAGGAAIALCPLGSYSLLTDVPSAATCPLCPSGYYCPNTTTQIACPANTNSAAGSSDLASCVCNAGYRCEVIQVVHAEVTLPISIADFAALQDQYIAAVAAAAGVDPSQVIIVSITDGVGGGGRRRLLNLGGQSPSALSVEIHTSIYGSAHTGAPHRALRDLDAHLVRAGLPPQSRTVQVFLHREIKGAASLMRSLPRSNIAP